LLSEIPRTHVCTSIIGGLALGRELLSKMDKSAWDDGVSGVSSWLVLSEALRFGPLAIAQL
jgi:hypothetical protein